MLTAATTSLAAAQAVALGVLVRRLARGRGRIPAVAPRHESQARPTVSIVVPTRNEALRIGPCLDGLQRQGPAVLEVLVVDGGSTDGTREIVEESRRRDGRFVLLDEPPRPAARVGRPWAIEAGCRQARGEWILVVDADTAPHAGMVGGVLEAAHRHRLDAVSFGPRIVAPSSGAQWLQPAFLATLVYRFGPPGVDPVAPDRVIANGQCMLLRRAVLERAGGYGIATDSYCDDVRIMRHLAERGARVGFLDGSRLLDVTMYPTARETWRAWPPSLNLRDSTRLRWRWLDAAFLVLAQAIPLPLLGAAAAAIAMGVGGGAMRSALLAVLGINALLVALRLLLLAATARSFRAPRAAFWLSPFADLPAVLRVVQASLRPVREWRGQPRAGSSSPSEMRVHLPESRRVASPRKVPRRR